MCGTQDQHEHVPTLGGSEFFGDDRRIGDGMNSARYCIVNVDDFGISRGVDRGVI